MKMLILCILLSISLSASSLKAQALFDCPPNTTARDWGDPISAIVEPLPFDFWATVDYYERIVGGKLEMLVDWSTFNNRRQPISDETMKEVTLLWLTQRNFDPTWRCPFYEPKSVSFIEQTECKTTTKCVLHLDRTQQVDCCDDPNINPEI